MEVKEVLSYYIDQETNILEVSFRLFEDADDMIRTDNIDFDLTKEYGYKVTIENFDFLDSDAYLIEDVMSNNETDYNELLNFLTEYYTINEGSLPDAQLF